jgi:hypothetical protein
MTVRWTVRAANDRAEPFGENQVSPLRPHKKKGLEITLSFFDFKLFQGRFSKICNFFKRLFSIFATFSRDFSQILQLFQGSLCENKKVEHSRNYALLKL